MKGFKYDFFSNKGLKCKKYGRDSQGALAAALQ
jgi:hypothetical protein